MAAGAWWWRYDIPALGTGPDRPELDSPSVRSVNFPTQSDAETWIGEQWRELLASGVTAVVLVEDGRVVYGPMDLHPAG